MTNHQHEVTLEQELHYIHQQYPDYLERFLSLMEQGKIDGLSYLNQVGGCACFYGHLFPDPGGYSDVHRTQGVREHLTQNIDLYTPIEHLINEVEPDETPETNQALSTLKEAIEHILAEVTPE